MTTPSTRTFETKGVRGTLEMIGEKQVITREPAQGPDPHDTSKLIEYKTVNRVLLEDETELFQCVYPGTDCFIAFSTVRSVTAHQRVHSPRKEAERLREQLNGRQQRKQAGGQAASTTRKERVERVKEVGAVEMLRRLATSLEVHASELRAVAVVVEKQDNVDVTAEELAQLRKDSTELQTMLSIFNRGK